jgi:hypothetical protein
MPIRKPKICPTVAKMLTMARESRADDAVNTERMKEEFGVEKVLKLGDLDDFQLLQALFIEQNWALGQQGREMQTLTAVAGLNRQSRRRIARSAGR